jgi:AcrR family transcriptional regulator
MPCGASATGESRPRRPSAATVARYEAEKQAIMRAAFRLIGSKEGWTSVNDILARAGLSTRAFYRHFRSKDELILAMYRTAHARVMEELAAVAATAGSPRAALEAWIDHWLAVAYDPRRAAQSVVLSSPEAHNAKGFTEVHQEARREVRAILVELLEAGRRDGTFPAVEPVEDARALQSVVGGLVDDRLRGEDAPARSQATHHTLRLFLRAFGAKA